MLPYSPQRMLNAGSSIDIDKLTLGVTVDFWDKYYGKYDNLDQHQRDEANPNIITKTSGELPFFLSWNANAIYKTFIVGSEVTFRAEVRNIFSRRDNFQRASTFSDFGL